MPIQPNDLKESNEFLNLVLENINAAVLIADKDLRIHYYNKSFSDLFDPAADSPVDQSFGRIAGCINAVQEDRSCGNTSGCGNCLLRTSLLKTLTENQPVKKKRLERIFYLDGKPIKKILEFSNRIVRFRGEKLLLVIIYDISDIEKQRRMLEEQQETLRRELETAAEIQKSLLPTVGPIIRQCFRHLAV